jgi:hypothetical protein
MRCFCVVCADFLMACARCLHARCLCPRGVRVLHFGSSNMCVTPFCGCCLLELPIGVAIFVCRMLYSPNKKFTARRRRWSCCWCPRLRCVAHYVPLCVSPWCAGVCLSPLCVWFVHALPSYGYITAARQPPVIGLCAETVPLRLCVCACLRAPTTASAPSSLRLLPSCVSLTELLMTCVLCVLHSVMLRLLHILSRA